MHNPEVVRRLHHFAQPLEERDERGKRHRRIAQHFAQRRPAHELHGDPQDPVGLGAEGAQTCAA